MSAPDIDVLVVGAGPAGLTLALQAGRLGARVRIVERRREAFRPSRAFIVHARTLEVLRPLGVADELVARGVASPHVDLHLGSRVVHTQLGPFAVADTAYPFLLFAPQAMVESTLADAVAASGIEIERGVEVTDVRVNERGAEVGLCRVERPVDEPPELISARYVAGCDGAGSAVRRLMGVHARADRYDHDVVLADVELDTAFDVAHETASDELVRSVGHMALGGAGLVFVQSPAEQATWRVLGTLDSGPKAEPHAVGVADVQRLLDGVGLDATVTGVAWSSRIPLTHRLVRQYRAGPVFLVGDAAHTHSPAGGQGMNTGIQDAVNLGWKLAFSAARPDQSSSAVDALLDSYESERRPVARRMLAATRLLFWVEAGTDPVARLLRARLGPLGAPFVPFLLRRRRVVAWGVRSLSQLRFRYPPAKAIPADTRRASDHREASDTRQHGRRPWWPFERSQVGRRLPDCEVTEGVRLHDLTATPGVHVLLDRDAVAVHPSHVGRWTHIHRRRDQQGEGVTIVRPDGYVGYRSDTAEVDRIVEWLQEVGAAN